MRRALLLFALLPCIAYADPYYWVGGSGNWADLTHWATTSGGNIYHNTVPGSGDDIYFDANSGSGPVNINVNVTTVYAKDFQVSAGAPAITLNSGPVTYELFGSLVLAANFSSSLSDAVKWNLSGTGTHNIDLGGSEISSLNLNGTGSYTLQDSLKITHNLKLNSGDFDANSHYVRCAYLNTNLSSGDHADFSNSTLLLTAMWSAASFSGGGTFDFSGSTLLIQGSRASLRTSISDTLSLNEIVYLQPVQHSISGNSRLKIKKMSTSGIHSFEHITRIDSLSVEGGSILNFRSGSATKIGHLSQITGCTSPIYLQGDDASTDFEINLLNANSLTNATFLNLNVTGAALTATHSHDIGGSSGITLNAAPATTYYWVGGSGDWEDSQHWSLASGGTSAGCIPGVLDHIIFDGASSSTDFTVNLANHSHVGNLTSTSDDELQLRGDGWFAIHGSLHLNDATTLDLMASWNASEVLLTNDSGIDSLVSPNKIRAGLTLLGDGSYAVRDSLKVENIIAVVNGRLLMPDCYVEAGGFRDQYYPLGGGVGDSSYADIRNTHMVISGGLEFRKSTFRWDYDHSLVEVTGNWSSCYFDQSQPFWELRFSNRGAQNTINWDGFTAKTVDVYSTLNVNTSYIDPVWDTLRVQAGATLNFRGQPQTLHLKHLDTRTNCFGFATIQAETKMDSLTLNCLSDSLVGQYVLLQNLTNGTPTKPVKAYSSIDLGGNRDITFSLDQARTLYWVGDAGVWQDSAHWSLTSGGTGGECIPTPADSVVFDNNSFSTAGLTVNLETYDAYCGDFVVTPSTDFSLTWNSGATLQCFKNMVLQPTLTFNGGGSALLYFRGNDSAYFNPAQAAITLPIQIEKANYATLTLRDSLYATYGVNVQSGGLLTLGNSVHIRNLSLENNGDSTWAEVDSSVFDIWGNWSSLNIQHQDIGWVSNGAEIYLTSDRSQARIYTLDSVEHLEFTSENTQDYNQLTSGSGSHIQYVRPHANLIFRGSTSIDTLILTPDQVYSFDPYSDHIIHDSLYARGNFCNYIGLKSTQIGTQADLYTYHNVGADFLEIRDLNYAGTGTFYTGAKSNDQGNNTGFLWDNFPGYVYGFPADTTQLFCHDSLYTDSLLLTTENFNDAVGFTWSTGDSTAQLWVQQSGLYWVEADYITCSVIDTIQVNLDYKAPLLFKAQACLGDTLQLLANQGDQNYRYLWSTGDTTSALSLILQSDTLVYVDIFIKNRWVCSDTAHIEAVSLQQITASTTDPLCSDSQDGQISINSVVGGHGPFQYHWSHDASLQSPLAGGLAPGCYAITTTDTLGCARVDTLCLTAPLPLVPTFTLTQPYCEGDPGSASLGAQGGTPSYLFTHNFNPASLPSGTYSFTVTDTNGCNVDTSFSIAHTFDFNYSVLIDSATCGENNGSIQILPADPSNAYTYTWSSYPGYSNNGQIFMPVSNGFIYLTDSITGCQDTVYYEIPAGGITSALFLTSQDSGISPLTVTTTNLSAAPGLLYYWILDGDTISTAEDTTLTFTGYGNYQITLCVVDPSFGCQFCYEKTIQVLPNPKFDAPNFFTPNFDGTNDFFELIVGQDLQWLEVDIYNRWDQLIYQSNATDFQWDGRALNGLPCAPGVYFWIIRYAEVGNPNPLQSQGTVHLIR